MAEKRQETDPNSMNVMELMDLMESPEKEIHLSEYFEVLRKRKKMILTVMLLIVAGLAYYAFNATPVFQSTATMIIESDNSAASIKGQSAEYEGLIAQGMDFNTHYELITFTPVIERVIKSLKLEENQPQALEISPVKAFIHMFRENISKLLNMEERTLTTEEDHGQMVNMIRSKITIEPLKGTLLLNILVKDKNPEMAADIANAVAQQYVEFNMSNRMEASKETMEWLNTEIYSQKKKLEQDEKRFFGFKKESKVFSIEGKQNMASQKIFDFNNKYLEARNKRVELDAKIAQLAGLLRNHQAVSSVRSLLSNPLIDTLYKKQIDLKMTYAKLDKMYKSKHPKIVQIKDEIAKTDANLAAELRKERANLEAQRKVLIAREDVLAKTIKDFESDALETSGKELAYGIFKRDVDISKNLYNDLLERVKASGILSNTVASNIRLVETAIPAINPFSPNKRRILVLGLVLGLFLGCGLAFLLEYMDQTLRTEDDIHKLSDIPVLSVIPEADGSQNYGA